jgi:hypothetical protein
MNQRLFQVFTLPPEEQKETHMDDGHPRRVQAPQHTKLFLGRVRGGVSKHLDHGKLYVSDKTQPRQKHLSQSEVYGMSRASTSMIP